MERDEFRQKGGDMTRDLEEKESSVKSFGEGESLKGPVPRNTAEEGTMGDSRPDRIDPQEAHFVDGADDPNLRVVRHTSQLSDPEREGAEELDEIRRDDTTIVARPQPPLMEEGAELRPRQDGGEQS